MITPIFGYSGIGKSTYASEFPLIAKDMQPLDNQTMDQFMLEVGKTIQSGEYKYVFLPCDIDLRNEFIRRNIAFVVILPLRMHRWVRRWVKSGDSAAVIKRRVERFDTVEQAFDSDPVIYIDGATDEWIGNVLSQYGGTDAKKEEQ